MDCSALAGLDSIGPERAQALETELRERKGEIEELLSCLEVSVTKSSSESSSGAKPTVCFTGKMPEKRSYYEKLASEHGYEAVDSVTSGLSLLVTAEESSISSKAVKAAKAGVRIMSLTAFLETLNNMSPAESADVAETEPEKNPEDTAEVLEKEAASAGEGEKQPVQDDLFANWDL